MLKKQCSKCKKHKPLSDFYKQKNSMYGVRPDCKACVSEVRRNHYQQNKEEVKARVNKYKKENKEKVNALKRKYPEKRKAAYLIEQAIKNGEIIKPDKCSECGKGNRKIEGHHEDYSNPLEVQWLCVKCHNRKKRVYR